MFPISEHSFYMQAIKKLYKAKTTDKSLFITPKKEKVFEDSEDEDERIKRHQANSLSALFKGAKPRLHDMTDYTQVKQNKVIKVSVIKSCLLYLESNILDTMDSYFCCLGKSIMNKKSKLKKMYDMGKDRIENELNMVRILRNLKNHDVLMKRFCTTHE